MKSLLRIFRNGEAFPHNEIPRHDAVDFLQGIITGVANGWRVISFFGVPGQAGIDLYAIIGFRLEAILGIMTTTVRDSFPTITTYCPQVHLFEREIAEQWGVVPEGHPWFKPVRYHHAWQPGADAWARDPAAPILPGVTDFYRVRGEGVHEVAVGPVHAGIIEPGHFRFQCHGEEVFHLEIALGYQHRGIERRLAGGPDLRALYQLEAAAGDTTIGHTQAYAMVLEALGSSQVPERGEALRAVALELERLANHTGDLGALANDVGFLPTASYCGRIRGDFLNLTALICGSRFGRGLVRPGGTGFDLAAPQADELRRRLVTAGRDLANAVDLLWATPSVMARFESAGPVSRDQAKEIGLVGVAARACGVARDVRSNYPFGWYRQADWTPVTDDHGDVYARAWVRWLECRQSLDLLDCLLDRLPAGPCRAKVAPSAGGMVAVALTEGWRGEICHTALTDEKGRFRHYKLVDPSFHNWTGLALALRGQQISDFPLCNKSFNLSYCGFDL
jgi:Ni,Fe-hydrogenase III large subunit